jgi:hypothetical protein
LHKKPVLQLEEKFVEDIIAIRKSMGLTVPAKQKLYNVRKFAGFSMVRKTKGKK